MKTILLTTSILLSGCCSVPGNPVLNLPPPLVVPVVKAEEIKNLPNDVKKRLQIQNKLRKQRIVTLQNIIKSTQPRE